METCGAPAVAWPGDAAGWQLSDGILQSGRPEVTNEVLTSGLQELPCYISGLIPSSPLQLLPKKPNILFLVHEAALRFVSQ